MAIFKTVLWSVGCVALGLALATVEVGGQTPWNRVRGLTSRAPKLEAVRGELEGAVATAKVKLAPKQAQPTESHLDSEREAVNALVARRGKAPRSP
jgi:hypothetical protein